MRRWSHHTSASCSICAQKRRTCTRRQVPCTLCRQQRLRCSLWGQGLTLSPCAFAGGVHAGPGAGHAGGGGGRQPRRHLGAAGAGGAARRAAGGPPDPHWKKDTMSQALCRSCLFRGCLQFSCRERLKNPIKPKRPGSLCCLHTARLWQPSSAVGIDGLDPRSFARDQHAEIPDVMPFQAGGGGGDGCAAAAGGLRRGDRLDAVQLLARLPPPARRLRPPSAGCALWLLNEPQHSFRPFTGVRASFWLASPW
jgi:hypothetical protein